MTVGMRQVLLSIYPARVPGVPAWAPGPLPVKHAGSLATADLRRTYFRPRTARALYGTTEHPRRWHQKLDTVVGDSHVVGVELLRLVTSGADANGLAIVHAHVKGPHLLDAARRTAGRRGQRGSAVGELEALFDGHGTLETTSAPYTVTLLTPRRHLLDALYPEPSFATWDHADQWLWALASRTNTADYPPDPASHDDLLAGTLRLSADWRALVLRDGAAFVGLRPDAGPDDAFFGHAERNVRTLYLDALLLGMLQRRYIDALAEDVATAFDRRDFVGHLTQLEARIARFRGTYWWQHLTTHGPANDLLRAYQDQHRLPELFDQVLAEVEDFTRIAQSQESQQINAALGILTIVGLPLGTALSALSVLGYREPWQLGVGVALALATTVPLFTTRLGHSVRRSLRTRQPDSDERASTR